jgi:hypothetical protein
VIGASKVRDPCAIRRTDPLRLASASHLIIELGLANDLDLCVVTLRGHRWHPRNFPLELDRLLRGNVKARIFIVEPMNFAPSLLPFVDRGEEGLEQDLSV